MKYAVSSITLRDLTMRRAKPPRKPLGPKAMPPHFSPRELSILSALQNPLLPGLKQMAWALGISQPRLKQYLHGIYGKLGKTGGNLRLATIWAMTHNPEDLCAR